MKIGITGGGTGGHFYPLISVVDELIKKEGESVELYYFGNQPYDADALKKNNIHHIKITSGKLRLYFSLKTIPDMCKLAWGCFSGLFKMFSVYPDVLFSKGGYDSFPALFAARIFQIPVIIHESDTVPGRVTLWSQKFARRVATSYEEALEHIENPHKARVGNPVRKELLESTIDPYSYFNIQEKKPILLIVGGSQGAKMINNLILSTLTHLLEHFIVIHQCGNDNFESVKKISDTLLETTSLQSRYILVPFLDSKTLGGCAKNSYCIITRAGSMLFEIAAWNVPAIVIPIPESISRDQRKNAFAFVRAGCGIVIEEHNLTNHIFISELNKIIENKELYAKMKASGSHFAPLDAASKIADEIILLANEHNSN